MYVCVHYDLFITRVCDGVWKHSFGGYLVLLHSSLITKINSIYKSTLRYRLQWKHVENELINCLFYLREKLDNLITYFSMFPNRLGGGWVSVLKEVYELYKWMNLCTGNGTILQLSIQLTLQQNSTVFIVDMKFICLISFALIFCRDFTSTFTQSVLFS